jgi:hypothetical protein
MNQKNNITNGLIVLLLILASSCTKRNYPTETKSTFPLAVGNNWTYEETYFFNNIWDSLRSRRTVLQIITKDTLLADNQLAFIIEERSGNYTHRYMRYEKDEELVESYFNSEHVNILITKNLKKGLAWDTYPSVNRNVENDEKRVTEEFTSYPFRNESVRAFRLQTGIPDLLRSNQTGSLTEELYAPQIGVIEATYYSNFYGPTRTYRVLTDYFLK